jgi:ubiquinol-cytochrome c reductase cytochrome b subunit
MRAVLDWIDSRTGLVSGVQHFFDEEIPASSGWHQVFGSVAVFSFLVQAFTGVLLAMNYAPTAGEAYYSLKYIVMEVTGGRLIRQMHHWGASMMIVIVVLHMVQVFLWGAYKKPREATWLVGVVLLLLTLGYGLTGYLLPWDNRAYWGTVVATQIAGTAPLAGAYVQQFLGAADGTVGALTFARFYAIHVLLLPPATVALIALHVFLVRKHGVAPQPGDEAKPKKKFYPEQVFKDTVAIFVSFAILMTLAIVARVPLERMADPTDTTYIPRPDWYFLFLFQLLKFFEGPLEVFGTVILPTLAVIALALAPFIDRSKMTFVRQRTLAFGVVLLAGLGWGALTYAAAASTPRTAAMEFDATLVEPWQNLAPKELAAAKPGDAPEFAIEAAKLYGKFACGACHIVNGEGGKLGPELNALLFRRDRAWVEGHFAEPQKFSPGTTMPPYKFTPPQMDAMVRWLMALPPQ